MFVYLIVVYLCLIIYCLAVLSLFFLFSIRDSVKLDSSDVAVTIELNTQGFITQHHQLRPVRRGRSGACLPRVRLKAHGRSRAPGTSSRGDSGVTNDYSSSLSPPGGKQLAHEAGSRSEAIVKGKPSGTSCYERKYTEMCFLPACPAPPPPSPPPSHL